MVIDIIWKIYQNAWPKEKRSKIKRLRKLYVSWNRKSKWKQGIFWFASMMMFGIFLFLFKLIVIFRSFLSKKLDSMRLISCVTQWDFFWCTNIWMWWNLCDCNSIDITKNQNYTFDYRHTFTQLLLLRREIGLFLFVK